jgi:hypothetical protein
MRGAPRIIDIDRPENNLVNWDCPEPTVVLATNKPIAEEHFRGIPEVETVVHIDLRFTIRVRATIVQVNGVRLVAAMYVHRIAHILTLNVSDFTRFPDLAALHPNSV